MNGYSVIFMVAFILVVAAAAGTLSWILIRSVSTLSHHPFRRHNRRS